MKLPVLSLAYLENIGFIILVVYRSLIDGGLFLTKLHPWPGPGLLLPSGQIFILSWPGPAAESFPPSG
jgi:hypothetical protein